MSRAIKPLGTIRTLPYQKEKGPSFSTTVNHCPQFCGCPQHTAGVSIPSALAVSKEGLHGRPE